MFFFGFMTLDDDAHERGTSEGTCWFDHMDHLVGERGNLPAYSPTTWRCHISVGNWYQGLTKRSKIGTWTWCCYSGGLG